MGMNNTLPDDIEQLKALLIAQQAVIVRLSGEITGYAREKIEKKIARAETRITELQNRLGEA
ncbi:transposase-like protein [Escherichia coli]|nr:transposase-like protein [Escherichia coli]